RRARRRARGLVLEGAPRRARRGARLPGGRREQAARQPGGRSAAPEVARRAGRAARIARPETLSRAEPARTFPLAAPASPGGTTPAQVAGGGRLASAPPRDTVSGRETLYTSEPDAARMPEALRTSARQKTVERPRFSIQPSATASSSRMTSRYWTCMSIVSSA